MVSGSRKEKWDRCLVRTCCSNFGATRKRKSWSVLGRLAHPTRALISTGSLHLPRSAIDGTRTARPIGRSVRYWIQLPPLKMYNKMPINDSNSTILYKTLKIHFKWKMSVLISDNFFKIIVILIIFIKSFYFLN